MRPHTVAWGLVAWLAAIGGAAIVHLLDTDGDGLPRYNTLLAGLLLVAVAPPIFGAWTVWKGDDNRNFALGVTASTVWVIGSFALYRLFFMARFPADFLATSESSFVNDIIKLRTAAPLYGQPELFESYVFAPGAPMVTYAAAWLAGGSDSIPVLRGTQILYALISAALATACFVALVRRAAPDVAWRLRPAWGAIVLPFFFLIATSPEFSPGSTVLSDDGLAQVTVALGYLILLDYMVDRSHWWLVAMALVPALGFFVEQPQLAWLGVYAGFLALFDAPRSALRATLVGVGGALSIALVAAICLGVWGEPFRYWVLGAFERHQPDGLAGLSHLAYTAGIYAMTCAGAVLWWSGPRERPLWGAWVLVLGGLVVYTLAGRDPAGIPNVGPAALVGAVWFMATVVTFYERSPRTLWTAPLLACVVLAALFLTGSVPRPANPLSREAEAYARRVETEMEGLDPDRVLIDVGAFVHLKAGRVWRDGAASVAEATLGDPQPESSLTERIQNAYYDKILLRLGSSPADSASGTNTRPQATYRTALRTAMLKAYRVDHEIPAVAAADATPTAAFGELSVLVPRKPRTTARSPAPSPPPPPSGKPGQRADK